MELLKRLCETPGIASREDPIRGVIHDELKPLVTDLRVDALGNLIAYRQGQGGPRVMIAAHMDQIGFMARHIDENGFIRLQPVGGFDPRTLVAQRVRVHGQEELTGVLMPATKPTHLLDESERGKALQLDALFVDVGLSGERTKELVPLGTPITFDRTCNDLGDVMVSPAMDDRVSVYIMIEAIRGLGEHNAEVYAVASSQEEVGLRGATVAAFGVEPDIGLALDGTLAVDIPGSTEADRVSKLGDGTAIKIMDSSLICDPRLVAHCRNICDKNDIKYQMEILPRGGTDGGAIQRTRDGVPAITISTPTRYVHTVNEMVHKQDVAATVDLVRRFIETAHEIDLSWK
ncbi:MAG: M42 family metallopeptidase [Chloroflexota bacterium]|nr:M42 family metallopeptidase [Chloroflexota bacterium]